METIDVRSLIKAGFHFGHRTSRWNPGMKPYIFKRRNLIHIIDLRATVRGLVVGRRLAEVVASRGQYVLFIGTKRQAAGLIEREASRCGMPYVAQRWPGGLLTNYTTIRKRLERLDELDGLEATGQIDLYGKKMISTLRREKRKILRNLGGVRNMDRLPGLLVIIDQSREHIAVREAVKLGIPIIGLIDTDGDPREMDVIVPGNDDSIAAIEIYLSTLADAILKGRPGDFTPPVKQEPAEVAEVAEPVAAQDQPADEDTPKKADGEDAGESA